MIAEKLEIYDFRNIPEAVINFSKGVNVLVGDNAQGKTNALEAIYLFAEGKSFRAKSERELIRFGTKMGGARLTAFIGGSRVESLAMQYFADESGNIRREPLRNAAKVKKIGDMVGIFRAVLFCPEHLSLVKGGPGERRSFLDIAISQLKPVYLRSLQKYCAILAERNKLLKDARENRRVFDATNELWAEQLAECAAYITVTRAGYLESLDKITKRNFYDMTKDREHPEILYRPSCGFDTDPTDEKAVKERYLQLYTNYPDREITAGSTLFGVHRDEVVINLDSKEARLYASQGQDRSIALAMKLAEGELSERYSGDPPVFLFDDVMSELDGGRREYLLERFDGRQIIMTSCEPGFFKGRKVNIINVKNGTYTPEEVYPE